MLIFWSSFLSGAVFVPESPLIANPQALPTSVEDGGNKKIMFIKTSCNTKIQDTVRPQSCL